MCDDRWDSNPSNADVVCRQLGFPGGRLAGNATLVPAPLGAPMWLDDVWCSGHEGRLVECHNAGVGKDDCSDK